MTMNRRIGAAASSSPGFLLVTSAASITSGWRASLTAARDVRPQIASVRSLASRFS